MRLPEAWALPEAPPNLSAEARDAWRQTGYQLGEDLRLLGDGLTTGLEVARHGYRPQARTMMMAGIASLWSRAFLCVSDAADLVRRGHYQSAVVLVRQAIEHWAACAALAEGEEKRDRFREWTHTAFGRDAETRAEDIGIGHHFGGEVIAADADLRRIYRAASDLGRPNFGPTALFVAAGASHDKYPLHFADEAFHLGWAELLLGWLLRLDARLLHVALHQPTHFPADEALRERAVAHVRAVEAHLGRPGRCALTEATDAAGHRRHLLDGFRRAASDRPRRVLL